MKKFFNILLLLSVSFFLIIPSNTVSAKDETEELPFETQIIVKNADTGEIVDVELKEETANIINNGSRSADEELIVEYEAVIPLEFTREIQSRASETTIREVRDVRATLRISYTLNGAEEIKVTGVSGSWVGTSTTYTMLFSNKEVWLYDGVPLGNYIVRYPSVSDFSYTTNWGYVIKYPVNTEANAGARAFSSAKATISGMSGGYIVETLVTVP